MVVLDADRRGHPAGQAVERHRVRARRGLAASKQLAGGAAGVGGGRAAACRSPRSRSRSCRGCTAASPSTGPGSPACCCRTTGSRYRLTGRGSSPTAATRRAPATGRRRRASTAATCWRSSTASATGRRRPAVLGPLEAAGDVARARSSARHGRQHGGRARPRAAAGRRRRLARHVGHGLRGQRHADRRPDRAVAGFADATGRFLPLVCTLNATKVTDAVARLLGVDHDEFDASRSWPTPPRRRRILLPYLDGERTPNRPSATGVLAGLRTDVTREQLARAAVEGVVCGLLDALDALRAHAARRRPARARRRRRPQRRLPPCPRRARRRADRGERCRRGGGHRRLPCRRRRCSTGRSADDQQRWGLGGANADRRRRLDPGDLRERYAALRDPGRWRGERRLPSRCSASAGRRRRRRARRPAAGSLDSPSRSRRRHRGHGVDQRAAAGTSAPSHELRRAAARTPTVDDDAADGRASSPRTGRPVVGVGAAARHSLVHGRGAAGRDVRGLLVVGQLARRGDRRRSAVPARRRT